MIQDILPDVLNNHFEPLQPEAGDRVMLFREDRLLTRYDGERHELSFPVWTDFRGDETAVYLFSVSGTRYYLVMDAGKLPEGYELFTLRELRAKEQHSNLGVMVAFTAWHLYQWYRTSRYCFF